MKNIILICCRPVDISTKEREVSARLELAKDRVPQQSMSRTNSRQATERGPSHPIKTTATPPSTAPASGSSVASTVRPSFSFANAAGAKATGTTDDQKATEDTTSAVHDVTDQEVETSA